MIRVKLTVGVGLWTAHREVELAAAPHVGDIITLTELKKEGWE